MIGFPGAAMLTVDSVYAGSIASFSRRPRMLNGWSEICIYI